MHIQALVSAHKSSHTSLKAHTSAHTSLGAHTSAHTSLGAHTSARMCDFLPRVHTSCILNTARFTTNPSHCTLSTAQYPLYTAHYKPTPPWSQDKHLLRLHIMGNSMQFQVIPLKPPPPSRKCQTARQFRSRPFPVQVWPGWHKRILPSPAITAATTLEMENVRELESYRDQESMDVLASLEVRQSLNRSFFLKNL